MTAKVDDDQSLAEDAATGTVFLAALDELCRDGGTQPRSHRSGPDLNRTQPHALIHSAPTGSSTPRAVATCHIGLCRSVARNWQRYAK